MTTTDWTTITKGTEVRVTGVRGVFVFHAYRNNEVTVYGGDRNPNGVRMFRTFFADRCRVYHPRKTERAFQPGPSIPPPQRTRRR